MERVEVPLFASNEPITLTGSRAQRVLQRRINQSMAEYEVLNSLEQSWVDCARTSAKAGASANRRTGYKAKIYRHPTPPHPRLPRGRPKHGSSPTGYRARPLGRSPAGAITKGLGYDTIADRLNADPAKYPPPEPPGKVRARDAWGKTSVYEILHNPEYTGYQVFSAEAPAHGAARSTTRSCRCGPPSPRTNR